MKQRKDVRVLVAAADAIRCIVQSSRSSERTKSKTLASLFVGSTGTGRSMNKLGELGSIEIRATNIGRLSKIARPLSQLPLAKKWLVCLNRKHVANCISDYFVIISLADRHQLNPQRRLQFGQVFSPQFADRGILPVFATRALRGFADGFVAVILPVYLLALGLGGFEIGAVATVTLFGSAMATLAVGAWGHKWASRGLLMGAATLMVFTGLGFSFLTSFWPLLIVAFVGTINPSSGDVSVFLPLEHAGLAAASDTTTRTDIFARYAFTGALFGALGALASSIPDMAANQLGIPRIYALRGMFILYGLIGAVAWFVYRKLPSLDEHHHAKPTPLGPSRAVVIKLSTLFSVDSFAGGFVVNSILALWLFEKFGLSLVVAGVFFFGTSLLGAFSQLAAPNLASRIGLVNTMVFTHIPASICLIAAAFTTNVSLALGLLLARACVSSIDVPARNAFVMSVVKPNERAAAASFTAVPRSLASAASPILAGLFIQSGWTATPLVVCGVLKIAYDLALWRNFRLFQHTE